MSANFADILTALMTHAEAMEIGSPPLPISYPEHSDEGRSFDPAIDAPDGKYLEVRFFSNRHAWEGVSSGVMKQGLLQVDVVWPRGEGLIAPGEAADLVAAHWAKGATLFSGAAKVTLDREPQVHTPLPGDTEVRVPVSTPWSA